MAAILRFPAKPRALAAQAFILPTAESAAEEAAACVTIPAHPLVTVTWAIAAIIVAVGLGPWISRAMGVFLPAYALVRVGRTDVGH